jgi:hypothetical protein
MTRVALYARYSTDNQREASIEDRFRICREEAKREKWKIVGAYRNAGISGRVRYVVRFIDIISMDGLGRGLGGQRFALPTTPQLQQKNCSIDRIEGS